MAVVIGIAKYQDRPAVPVSPPRAENVRVVKMGKSGMREVDVVDKVLYCVIAHKRLAAIGNEFTKTNADDVFVEVYLFTQNCD